METKLENSSILSPMQKALNVSLWPPDVFPGLALFPFTQFIV
jgi:hypothetical protein